MPYTKSEIPFVPEMTDLENIVFVCFGQPDDEDLPQTASDEGVIIDLVDYLTGKCHEMVEAEYRHQTDPSYHSGY